MLDKILKTFFVKIESKDKINSLRFLRSNSISELVDVKIKIPEETTALSGYFKHIKGLAVKNDVSCLYEHSQQ